MDRLISSEEIYLAETEVVAAEEAYLRARTSAALETVCETRRAFEGLLAERFELYDESL